MNQHNFLIFLWLTKLASKLPDQCYTHATGIVFLYFTFLKPRIK